MDGGRTGNGRAARNGHEKLLISIADKFGLEVEALRPRLLDNGGPGTRRGLVEGRQRGKINLLVKEVL